MPGAAGDYEIATPILDHQHRLLGLLQARNLHPFSTENIPVVQAFAVQAAIGLERARIFDRMRDWTTSLEALLSFNAVINQYVEPAQLVRRLVENAARFLEADGGRTGLAVPAATAPGGKVMISDAYWFREQWHDRPRRWEMGRGIPGFLLESEFSYIANDYREDRLGDASLMEDYDVRRALCVPIKNMDETLLGFFQSFLRGPGSPPFTWQDAAFLGSLADTTAVAIHNRQLVTALEIKSEQIQALSADHVKRLEAERTHISRELHDESGQVLVGIKLALQVLARKVPPEPPQLQRRFRQTPRTGQHVDSPDQGSGAPVASVDAGSARAQLRLAPNGYRLHETDRRPGEVRFRKIFPERLPPDTETALLSHRPGSAHECGKVRERLPHVEFALRRDGDTCCNSTLQDDGIGFRPFGRRFGARPAGDA